MSLDDDYYKEYYRQNYGRYRYNGYDDGLTEDEVVEQRCEYNKYHTTDDNGRVTDWTKTSTGEQLI